MSEIEKVNEGLKPLFEKAEKDRLFFFSTYQHLWFSPSELKEAQSQGRFQWGACNWELRDPNEKTKSLELEIENKKKELEEWKKRCRAL